METLLIHLLNDQNTEELSSQDTEKLLIKILSVNCKSQYTPKIAQN